MDIKSAFLISAIAHAGIVGPFYNHNVLRHDFSKLNPVIVDYVILKELTGPSATNIVHRESVATLPVAPKIEAKLETPQTKLEVKNDDTGYRKTKSRARREAARKEARIKSSKDYLAYYDHLKGRIKTRLEENYRFYKGEGYVYLSFALGANGALLAFDIDRSRSSRDDVLLQITSASLKSVSPFPPLPKAISAPRMSFSITIEFKK